MIITLAKADFRTNNIGQLSSFSILTNLGNGCTYTGAISIASNERYTGLITVSSQYNIKNVVVTMGGEEIHVATIDGNRISLDIPAVTGIVMISVETAVDGPAGVVLFNTVKGAPKGGSYGAGGVSFIEPGLIPAGTWVDYIDLVAMEKNAVPTSSITIDGLKVYTTTTQSPVKATEFATFENYASIASDKAETAGMQIFRIPVGRKFDTDVFFGFTAITTNTTNAPTFGYNAGATPLGAGACYMGTAIVDGNSYALNQKNYSLPMVIYG